MAAPRQIEMTGRMIRMGVGAAVLVILVQQLGTGPFLRAFDRVTIGALGTAMLITAVTTLCCAWRWSWIAGRLNLRLDIRAAVPAYYRSQLVNQVLPGGILGDVDRAVRHGSDERSLSRAARAVAWDRAAGQVGLLGLALVALVGLPSELRGTVLWIVLAGLVVVGAAILVSLAARRKRSRLSATLVADARRLFGSPAWLPLALSVVATVGYLLVLLVALSSTGVDVPLPQAVPMLLVVLMASSIPANIAGWGPREGAAAWVFSSAGLDAADGVTVATLYGILSLVAAAPGALVLVHDLLPRRIAVDTP